MKNKIIIASVLCVLVIVCIYAVLSLRGDEPDSCCWERTANLKVKGKITVIASAKKERIIASGDFSGNINIWRNKMDKWVPAIVSLDTAEIHSIAVSSNGKHIAIGTLVVDPGLKSKMYILEEKENNWNTIAILQPFDKYVSALDFSPDGKTLIAGGNEPKIYFWELSDSGEWVANGYIERSFPAQQVLFSNDGQYIIAGGYKIDIWKKKNNGWSFITSLSYDSIGKPYGTVSLSVSADSKTIASIWDYEVVKVWQINKDGEWIEGSDVVKTDRDSIESLSFDHVNSNLLAVAFTQRSKSVLLKTTVKIYKKSEGENEWKYDCAINNIGKRIVFVDDCLTAIKNNDPTSEYDEIEIWSLPILHKNAVGFGETNAKNKESKEMKDSE